MAPIYKCHWPVFSYKMETICTTDTVGLTRICVLVDICSESSLNLKLQTGYDMTGPCHQAWRVLTTCVDLEWIYCFPDWAETAETGLENGWVVDNFNPFLLFLDRLESSKFVPNLRKKWRHWRKLSAHGITACHCRKTLMWPHILFPKETSLKSGPYKTDCVYSIMMVDRWKNCIYH